MAVPAGFLEVGKIVAAHGIRGEVRIYPTSDFPERFVKPGERWLLRPNSDQAEPIGLVKGYFQEGKGLYVIQLAAIDTRNRAEALRNCLLLVQADDRPKLAEGEYLVADLIGIPVYDQATQQLVGTVTDLFHVGNDLLEVAVEGRAQPLLIPFVTAIVPIVNVRDRRIEITPPPGLLDL
jgi:16S rRNA processing protein RimM